MALKKQCVFVIVFVTFVAGMFIQIRLQRMTIIYNTDYKMITHLTSSRRSAANIVAAKSFMTLKALPKYADSYITSVSKSARPIIAKQFTKLNSGLIYLFGAVVKNSTKNLSWDIVSVYAMVNTARHPNMTVFQCCIVYTYNHNVTQIYKVTPIYVRPHWANAKLMAYHFTCPNVLHWLMEYPAFIGITVTGQECEPKSEEYVEPIRSLQQPKSTLAISTQVSYGSVNAELIIEWIEAYRYLGVDKIVSYFIKNINKEALDVLLYYHNLKVIDLFYYVPAAEEILPRHFNDTSFQTFNDLTIVNHDAFETMSGYTYFGVIDFDEFLIPARNMKLKQMLKRLFNWKRNAAAFKFTTQYFYLSWGPTGFFNDMVLGRYVNTTQFGPKVHKSKLINKPNAVAQGGIFTHRVLPKEHFKGYTVPEKIGYIRHYRNCRTRNTTVYERCMHSYIRVQDNFMAKWSKKITKRVRFVRKQVLGSKVPL